MKVDKEAMQLLKATRGPFILLILLWSIHLAKVVWQLPLGQYGVFPRAVDGIKGIFLSPFIHGDFQHLFSNSFPVFFLTFLISYFYRKVSVASIFLIYILTGICVWLFGREVYHIGASGVAYGMVSFVFWSGLFRRNVKSIVLALVVLFLYQGYFLGIVPDQEGISWESHLIGAIVGIVVSFIFKGVKEEDEERSVAWETPDEPERLFLPSDTFEKTKAQRYYEQQQRLLAEQQARDEWNSDSTF